MQNHLLVVNGHPDPAARRYCAAVCDAYAAGARSRGWRVERLDVGSILASPAVPSRERSDMPLLDTAGAANRVRTADRLAIVFPLWLGAAPHVLQQLFNTIANSDQPPKPLMTAQLVVTMDLPALLYRPQTGAQKKPGALRNPFHLQGVHAGRTTLIGSVNAISTMERQRRLAEVQADAADSAGRAANAERRAFFGWRRPVSLPTWLLPAASSRGACAVPQH